MSGICCFIEISIKKDKSKLTSMCLTIEMWYLFIKANLGVDSWSLFKEILFLGSKNSKLYLLDMSLSSTQKIVDGFIGLGIIQKSTCYDNVPKYARAMGGFRSPCPCVFCTSYLHDVLNSLRYCSSKILGVYDSAVVSATVRVSC